MNAHERIMRRQAAGPQWRAGLITLTDEAGSEVMAQYDDADRWNGWLNPWLDPLAVVETIADLNRGYGIDGEHGLDIDWTDDGSLVLIDQAYDDNEPLVMPPDADGLYPLGAWGWVWHQATEVPA